MPSNPNEMTVLVSAHNRLCAKRHTRNNDGRIHTQGYDFESHWIPRPMPVSDFRELATAISWLSGQPQQMVIRGGLREGVTFDTDGLPRICHDREGQRAPFEETPRSWAGFDYDNPADFTRIGQLVASLPPCFQNVRGVVQYTSSQGLPGQRLRCRLWYLLSHPMTSVAWRRMAASWGVRPDLSLFRTVQPHYTARPQFINMEDPVPQRVVVLPYEQERVDVTCWSEADRLSMDAPDDAVLVDPENLVPSPAQLEAAIERILTQRTDGSRHNHAGGVACELYGLGCPPDRGCEVIDQVIRNQGREPQRNEARGWWMHAVRQARAGRLRTDNPALSQLFADEVHEAPPSTPEEVAAREQTTEANQEVMEENTVGEWGDNVRANAIRYLRQFHDNSHLVHWCGMDYTWDGRCWDALEETTTLNKRIIRDTTLSVRKANDTATVIRSMRLHENLCPPCRLDTGQSMSGRISFRNGWVSVEDLMSTGPVLRTHTPDYFNLSTLSVDYDPAATCPSFVRFLDSVFPNDPDARRLTAQMMGYLLVPDNRFQKMFFLHGRPGSGKSTLIRVIASIMGRESLASTQLAAASTNFGASTWLGKLALVISEANEGGGGGPEQMRGVAPQLVDLLKSISGGDEVQIDRKNLPPFNGHLPLRFLVVCNQMPRLLDQSGAFMRRLILLSFGQSFAANPDETLDVRLGAELPGIVNFALQGLKDLYAERRFTQPDSGLAVLESFRRQTSPIRTFCEDCLTRQETGQLPTTDIYDAYRAWCHHAGRMPANRDTVMAQVASATEGRMDRMRGADGRRRVLLGFALTEEGRALLSGNATAAF